MQISHQRPSVRTTQRARGEHGYILTLFAMLLVPLLLLVGFAVDVGYWYNRASDMRRAADAAALAGVVWLPDEAAARTAALASAAQNGFVPNANLTITVEPSTQSERRLKVTIEDKRVGSFFYESLGGKKINLQRTSFAEYVLAVPMGSPRNFFGTGTLFSTYTSTGMPTEWLYQSVNPYCTDKVNGDRYQSGFNGVCAGTANSEYRTEGYAMYVEAPKNRTAAIDIRLWDARYNEDNYTWTTQEPDDCVTTDGYPTNDVWIGPTGSSTNVTITGLVRYQTRANSTTNTWSATTTLSTVGQTYTHRGDRIRYQYPNVTYNPVPDGWTTSTSTSNVTINAPAQYQTRTSSGTAWSNPGTTTTMNSGATAVTRARNLIRYRLGTYELPKTVCTPVYVDHTEGPIDSERVKDGRDVYTYTLYSADNTPLDDSDNPVMCTKSFSYNTPFEFAYLGSQRWNSLCSIPTTGISGRYIVRVQNSGTQSSPLNDGSNQWGIVAKYAGSGDGLCDGRTDTMCPRVFGRDAISVRAAANTEVASFYLAEIAPEHAGKKLRLELFDPGEGGRTIEIMKPSGTNGNTWTPATFSWSAADLATTPASATGATSIDLRYVCGGSGSNPSYCDKFNGKLISITVDLSGYSPPANNRWWQIRYTFAGEDVTDRTTWSARIIGDPVHLVEEY